MVRAGFPRPGFPEHQGLFFSSYRSMICSDRMADHNLQKYLYSYKMYSVRSSAKVVLGFYFVGDFCFASVFLQTLEITVLHQWGGRSTFRNTI